MVAPLIIIDNEYSGHHLRYIRDILLAGLDDSTVGCRQSAIVVLPPEAATADEYNTFLQPLIEKSSQISVVYAKRGWISYFRETVKMIQRADGCRLSFPYADKMLPLAAILIAYLSIMRIQCSARVLLIRTEPINRTSPGFEFAQVRRAGAQVVKRVLSDILARHRSVQLYFLTDGFGVVKAREGYPRAKPILDPPPSIDIDCRKSDSSNHDETSRVFDIGIVGSISKRKRPNLLYELAHANPEYRVLLAGKVSDDTHLPETTPANLTLVDRYLSERELQGFTMMCESVLLAYDNDAPSGALVQAVLSNTAVIAGVSPWMKSVVESTGVGACLDEEDPAGLTLAIRAIKQDRQAVNRACVKAASRIQPTSLGSAMAFS